MGRPPLKVLLLCDGPVDGAAGASYLEMVLSQQGRFHVTRDGEEGGDGHDAVLVSASAAPRFHELPADPGVPVIVLAHWRPDPLEVEQMVEGGAEDVIHMAELSGARLESAVRKAVGRRARMPGRRAPLREALAGLVPQAGIVPHPWSATVPLGDETATVW